MRELFRAHQAGRTGEHDDDEQHGIDDHPIFGKTAQRLGRMVRAIAAKMAPLMLPMPPRTTITTNSMLFKN